MQRCVESGAAFAGLAAYRTRAATVAGPGLARQVQVAHVAGDLFSLLGVPVLRGRALAMTDAGTRVAVVGDDLWAAEWGSNPDVVGTTFSLDGDTYVVAGVAGRGFTFRQDSRVWVVRQDIR